MQEGTFGQRLHQPRVEDPAAPLSLALLLCASCWADPLLSPENHSGSALESPLRGPRKSWEEGLPRLACRALPAWPYLTCLAPPHPVCTPHLCSCACWERGSWKEGPQSVTSAKWLHIYQLGFQEP